MPYPGLPKNSNVISPEAVFLLTAVRRFFEPNSPSPDAQDVDVARLRAMAVSHAVIPIVYRTLQASAIADCADLRSQSEACAREGLRLTAELCAISDLLGRERIAFVPLKGPILSQRLYGDVSMRAYGDLDLLIHRDDVTRARDLLLRDGYQVASSLHWQCDSAFTRSRECELHMIHRERDTSIDLHWRILPGYFPSAFDRIDPWHALISTEIAGRSLSDLCAEHLLLFLCAHAGKHAFERLGWICDIARCVTVCNLDWEKLISIANGAGVMRQIMVGLRLAGDMLQTRLPAVIPQDAVADALVAQVKDRFFSGAPSPTPERVLIPFCFRMLESTHHRARYLAGHASVSDAEYAALQLPPSMYFLYYPFRPLRLAARYLGSSLR
jgi:hypothetical protein